MDLQNEFDKYFTLETLSQLPEEEQIDSLGQLVDLSFDLNRIDGVEKALQLSATIDKDKLTPPNYIVYHYDLANAWGILRKLKRGFTEEDWLFEQEELNNEIINSRIALNHPKFDTLQPERQSQILTNLGNLFSYIGRFVEAQDLWNRAIAIIPNFPMALANKGNGLVSYGKLQYENDFAVICFNLSYYLLNKALSMRQYMDPAATAYFESMVQELKANLSHELLESNIDLGSHSLGQDENEISYRKWCLKNTLFLHPINDITYETYAAHDCLMIPGVITNVGEAPLYHNFYNQIKQEFSSARYLLFEGLEKQRSSFADRDVSLTNTNELLSYSLNLEKVKISYRVCYSIFDKIAYFLNSYLGLLIPEKRVNFRTMWYSKNKELRIEIAESNNWALRGLYWLSKDLFDESLKDSIDPDSKELADIRNFMEHKSFKIHQYKIPESSLLFKKDDISFSISRVEFEAKTLKLMKLSRAAIFYLTYAMAQIEREKSKKLQQSVLPELPFGLYPEEYKV